MDSRLLKGATTPVLSPGDLPSSTRDFRGHPNPSMGLITSQPAWAADGWPGARAWTTWGPHGALPSSRAVTAPPWHGVRTLLPAPTCDDQVVSVFIHVTRAPGRLLYEGCSVPGVCRRLPALHRVLRSPGAARVPQAASLPSSLPAGTPPLGWRWGNQGAPGCGRIGASM